MGEFGRVHPGLPLTLQLHEVVGQVGFEAYMHFVHIDGLPEATTSFFIDFLRRLYDRTWFSWGPGLCAEWSDLFPVGQEILAASRLIGIHPRLEPRFEVGHHWWVLRGVTDDDLIVDPTGAQQPLSGQKLPFFGLISEASEYGQEVYTRGTYGFYPPVS